MSFILRTGLLVSLLLLVAGILAYVALHPHLDLAQAIATNPILRFLNLSGLGAGLVTGDPAAFLTVGLIGLVVTPILRVVTGFYYFRRGGERTMATVTLTVLILLLFGVLVLGPLLR